MEPDIAQPDLGRRAITFYTRLGGSLTVNVDLFQRIVETLDDVITLQDAQGRLIYVSPSAQRLLGLAPSNCLEPSATTLSIPTIARASIYGPTSLRRWSEPPKSNFAAEGATVPIAGFGPPAKSCTMRAGKLSCSAV